MYTAFNNNVICKVQHDTNLKNQTLSAKVVATTELTEALQDRVIIAERRYFIELSDTGESKTTTSGIILGDSISYAAINADNIVAVKDGE